MANLYQPQPPQPFLGGNQPLAPREFTPPSGPTAQPPHRTLPETVLASWRIEPWPQQQYRKLVQAAIAAAVQPPRRTLPETILAAWRLDSKTPVISGWQVQSYVPDNPPFGLEAWLSAALAQWQVTPWTQQRSARLIQEAVAAAAVNPPFDQVWLWAILNQWQAVAPVTQARKLSSGIPGQSVDKPPNRAIDLRAALISWQPPPPAQTFYAKFTQGIDNPPFGLPPRWRWDAPLTPAQVQYARYVQQAAIAAADNPPFRLLQPWNVFSQWQARALTPLVQALLVQEFIPSDNPPFGMPQDWLFGALGQWQIVTLTLIRQSKLAQAYVADRPPPRTTLNFITTLKAWEPTVIVPQKRLYLPQPFVTVPADNPPFGMPPDWLYSVLTASWKAGEPLPKLLQKILQAGAAPAIAHGPKEKRKWRRSSS